MSRALRAWGPVAACAVVIGVATTIYVPDVGLGRARFPFDKLVHFGMYLALGWAVARALWSSGHRSARAVMVAFLAGLAFAAVDEWHQTLLHWREASFADWLADAAGLSTGLVLYLWPRRPARAGEKEAASHLAGGEEVGTHREPARAGHPGGERRDRPEPDRSASA